MSLRYLSFAIGGIAVWAATAYVTRIGAFAFISPGLAISSVLFPDAPGTYVSPGAAGPAQAMMDLAVLKASERYIHSLWCAVAFWIAFALLLAVVGHHIHRRATDNSLERPRGS
jgi:hypothetical protein